MTTLQGVSSLAGGGCNYVTHYENSFSTHRLSNGPMPSISHCSLIIRKGAYDMSPTLSSGRHRPRAAIT